MAIHWKVQFKSLRSGTDYTVNIYDASYSGDPILLKGGAEPFVTQEDDDEDLFTPIRQQSGYIRIVDDGKDANGNALASGWLRQLLPANDMARPVTLTVGNTVMWQGFLQAENFSGKLYGNPQERDLPVQCILTVLGAKDASTTEKNIHNFAWLINYLLGSIDITTSSSPIGIDNLYFQGGAFAMDWLKKRIDWQNFITISDEGEVTSNYDHLTMLEDICKFWGWTARTHGRDLYFTCADDTTGAPGFLKLTMSELATLASGTAIENPTITSYTSATLTGDIFASVDNDDILVRGASKAVVTADWNSSGKDWFTAWPSNLTKDMLTEGWDTAEQTRGLEGNKVVDKWVQYTLRKASATTPKMTVSCNAQSASLCLARYASELIDLDTYQGVIHMQHYDGSTTYIQMQTNYAHIYDGNFQIKADLYVGGCKYTKEGVSDIVIVKMRFGIGNTRATAKWYTGNPTAAWSSTATVFDAHVGFSDGKWRFGEFGDDTYFTENINPIESSTGKEGLVFVDILSTDYFYNKFFYITDYIDLVGFELSYQRVVVEYLGGEMVWGNMTSRREYSASNGNMSRAEWNNDVIYASGKVDSDFGFGLVFNPTNRPMSTASYSTGDMAPEQHMANRVSSYWTASRRLVRTELRKNEVTAITPAMFLTIDGTNGHPISISHEWRDDIINVSIIEIPQ